MSLIQLTIGVVIRGKTGNLVKNLITLGMSFSFLERVLLDVSQEELISNILEQFILSES